MSSRPSGGRIPSATQSWISRYFELTRLRTTIRQELLAGVTTFLTASYIVIVNPAILRAAGIPYGPSMVATILTAFFGSLLMGVYAKRPFAIAPYMAENAFIAYTVVGVMGHSWQTALGAVFIAGVLFTLLTVLKVRSWLAEAIPESLTIGFTVGIGLFLTLIGLHATGIVRLGGEGAPLQVGNFHDPSVLLAFAGLILIGWLVMKKIPGAFIIGILATSVVGFLTGVAEPPPSLVSLPPDPSPVFFQLDIAGALSWGFFSVILTLFVMGFVDTLGTLLGLAYKARLLDEDGTLPEIEKPMLSDALATVAAALFGTTTAGAYLESASGIEAGGRSGFTAVVVSLLFLSALFFVPLFGAIPAFGYGPAVIMVGFLMLAPIQRLDFGDLSEMIPAVTVIVLMSFTFNIGIGMTAAFVVYPLFKVLGGRRREVKPGMWALGALSLLFFVFYPY
jgi:AGZA family xanthine/uracil permease-like MFS transporter